MYYGLILLTTVMFGIQFALSDTYRRLRGGGGLKVSMQSSLIGAIFGGITLCAVNGFTMDCTPFTLVMAYIGALCSFAISYCGFKALEHVNLSLYSLFMMLGGMVLPFLQGILFYGEGLTVAKIVCFIFIAISMLFTLDKGGKRGGMIYCIIIFILNGFGGIRTKIFTTAVYEKTSATDYSIWGSICTAVLAGIWLCLYARKHHVDGIKRLNAKSAACAAGCGVLNATANCILVIALAHVDSSVQYPMVSGGTMIISTIFGYFSDKKPGKKDWMAVTAAFIGMMALFVFKV